MRARTRIAVVGAGLIGARHAAAVSIAEGVELALIVDPAPAGAEVAGRFEVPHTPDLDAALGPARGAGGDIDGIILATPNRLHAEGALAAIAAGLPVLIEKPLAHDLESAEAIVSAGAAAGVPLLVGHHRRHNPLIAKAHEVIARGDLGQITTIQATTWFRKPDSYFDIEWRRRAGAGPLYLNLIHDIDLMRHLCGEIALVQAMQSNAVRGHEVEETAVVTLRFASGALGTLNISDTTVAPWSWELTARENPAYPATGESCYQIGGTLGALALPNFALWTHPEEQSWWAPITATRPIFGFDDPLVVQARHFGAVIRGEAAPLVTAEEGLANQRVIEAVKRSAETGQAVAP